MGEETDPLMQRYFTLGLAYGLSRSASVTK